MTDNEIALFEKYRNKSSRYFEWGSGGSTYLCKDMESITSIESDNEWIQKVMKDLSGNIIYVDIGSVKDFGVPNEPYEKDKWPAYSTAWSLRREETDLILIDGRFRVACALQVFLSGNSGTVLIHDFQRQEYQIVLDFFEVVERIDNLVVLQRKEKLPNSEWTRAHNLLKEYQYDFR